MEGSENTNQIWTQRCGSLHKGERKQGRIQVRKPDRIHGRDLKLPAFQHNVPWKKNTEKPIRRKIKYKNRPACLPSKNSAPKDKQIEDPAPRKKVEVGPSITRQHSKEETEAIKKPRTEETEELPDTASSSEESEEGDTEDGDSQNTMTDPLASDLMEYQ